MTSLTALSGTQGSFALACCIWRIVLHCQHHILLADLLVEESFPRQQGLKYLFSTTLWSIDFQLNKYFEQMKTSIAMFLLYILCFFFMSPSSQLPFQGMAFSIGVAQWLSVDP